MKNLKNNPVSNLSLTQEISNIAERMSAASSCEEVAKAERPSKRMSAAGVIHVYNKAEYDRQTQEKPAKPTMRYVFYRGLYNQAKMGSVAIYGGNPAALFSMMKSRSSLFGHRIVEVNLEKGLSTYVDVTFAA